MSLSVACQQAEKRSLNDDSQDLTIQPANRSDKENITATPQRTPGEITVNQPSPFPSAKPQATASEQPKSVARAPQNVSKPTPEPSFESDNSISKALTDKLSPKTDSQPNIPSAVTETEIPTQKTSPKPVVVALRNAAKNPRRKIAAASNTNVYRSQRLGVNFKYPKGFVIKEPQVTSSSSQNVVELWSHRDYQAIAKGKYENTFSPGNMSISLENNPEGLSLVEWIKNNDELGDIIPQSFEAKVVAGREAVSFRTDGLYIFQNIVLPSADGKKVILISLAKGDRSYQQVFEQVVSSLEVN